MPVVEVSRATYGHATDLSKAFDVTSEVRTLVQASGGTTADAVADASAGVRHASSTTSSGMEISDGD